MAVRSSKGECNTHKSKRRQEAGFSLLETLIALVILAFSLAALFEAYGDGLRAIGAGNRHGEARLLAQSVLADIEDDVRPGKQQGQQGNLSWQLEIKPATGELVTSDAKAKWALFEIITTIRWSPSRRIVVRTLRLGPAK